MPQVFPPSTQRLLRLAAAAVATVGIATAASAQTTVLQAAPQNLVSLTAQASADVPQDMVAITLQVLREGSDAASVQSQLRQTLDAALTEARKAVRPGQLAVRTGAFSLFPRYANPSKPGAAPAISGWQGQAELVLDGRDIGAISQLAGRLSGLTVSRVQPGLSREARDQAETEVAAQAIAQFKARAEAYARQFGFASYSLREVTVGGGELSAPQPQPMFRAAMAKVMSADESQPLAPGQTTVSVSVSGSIQLSPR